MSDIPEAYLLPRSMLTVASTLARATGTGANFNDWAAFSNSGARLLQCPHL